MKSRYLIGCDGASSTVRLLAGISLDDLDFDQSWLVVDVLANERGLAKLPTVSAQYCEPARPTTYVVCTGNHRRWELMLLPGEEPRRMESPDEVWRLLRRWIDPADAQLWRSASYRFHALVAADWRRGRIFVAGDAAHQQPPFLGQGMCQGVRDVANLAWKLARILQGKSGQGLLDTYGVERGGHVRRLHAVIKGIGSIVAERDEAAARIARRKVAGRGGRRYPLGATSATATVAGSRLRQPARQRGSRYSVSATHGRRLRRPQATGRVHGRTHARRFELRVSAAHGRAIQAGQEAGAIAIRITDVVGHTDGRESIYCETESVTTNWFGMLGCVAAIVRPDHYVFGTASDSASLTRELTDFALAVCSP